MIVNSGSRFMGGGVRHPSLYVYLPLLLLLLLSGLEKEVGVEQKCRRQESGGLEGQRYSTTLLSTSSSIPFPSSYPESRKSRGWGKIWSTTSGSRRSWPGPVLEC